MTGRELTPEQEQALHERWIAEVEVAWKPLFDACPDGVYVYIDDEHKTCSERFAGMFGMTVREFKTCESLLDECVDEDSIDLVMHTYLKHFEEEARPVRFGFIAKRRDGARFPVTVFNIPIVHDGQLMLLCFVREGSPDDEDVEMEDLEEALVTGVGASIAPR